MCENRKAEVDRVRKHQEEKFAEFTEAARGTIVGAGGEVYGDAAALNTVGLQGGSPAAMHRQMYQAAMMLEKQARGLRRLADIIQVASGGSQRDVDMMSVLEVLIAPVAKR